MQFLKLFDINHAVRRICLCFDIRRRLSNSSVQHFFKNFKAFRRMKHITNNNTHYHRLFFILHEFFEHILRKINQLHIYLLNFELASRLISFFREFSIYSIHSLFWTPFAIDILRIFRKIIYSIFSFEIFKHFYKKIRK